MIFGTLPIALTTGSRTSLGIGVVGGLMFAGVLTLYVIPSVYSYISRAHLHRPNAIDGYPLDHKNEQISIA